MTPIPDSFDTRVVIPGIDMPPRGDATAERLTLAGEAFATGWRIDLYAAAEAAPRLQASLQRRVQAWLDLIDRQMSPYRDESDLSRFNNAPAGDFVALPQVMMQVVRNALEIARLSDGAFDPSLLSAVELWGFGAKTVSDGLPAQAEIDALRDRTAGWRDLTWTPTGMVRPDSVRLDLCAIAKGYAVDGLADMLKVEPGVSAALVEVGGELKGFGVRPDGLPWWVEIERSCDDEPRTVVALHGHAVATSGDLRRSFVHDGLILSHTIDARTACPARPEIASATVLDGHAWRADALATALIVMGETAARAFAARHDIACLLRVREGEAMREMLSPAMEAWA